MLRNCAKNIVLSCGLIGLQTLSVWAENRPQDIDQLLVQGHFWYERGRNDLAEKSWRKVLRADPANAEANAGINELVRFDPDAVDRNKLRLARELARQKRYSEALRAYRDAFAGSPPTGYFASEYFETLGGQKARRGEAITGLRTLVSLYPSNPRFQLALGRVLSYEEDTRREAIEILSDLMATPELNEALATKALSAWRDSLLWLNASRQDAALYTQLLERSPDDAELQQRLDTLNTPEPKSGLQTAFELLDAGKNRDARKAFEQSLKSTPEDADALTGAGIANLRLKNFSRARQQLTQAIRLAPDKQPELIKSLQDASFWADYRGAEQALTRGRLNSAATRAGRLLRRRPKQTEALLLMGNIEAARQQYDDASRYFEQVLAIQKSNRGAQQALIGALINRGDDEEALRLLGRFDLPADSYTRARNQIKASQLQAEAARAQTPQAAINLLSQALDMTPDNPWLMLELARLHRETDNEQRSDTLVQTLLTLYPPHIDAAYAAARYHAENRDWDAAITAIDLIPDSEKPDEYQQFKWNLWGKQKLRQAIVALQQGQQLKVDTYADEIARQRHRTAEMPLIEAELLLEMDRTQGALLLAQQYKPVMEPGNEDLSLRYANILLRSGKLSELEPLLARLSTQIPRQAAQHKSLQDLKLGLALQQSRLALGSNNDVAAAYQILTPWLPQYQNNINMRLALAEIASRTDRHEEALELYRKSLKQQPDNLDAVAGVYGEALALREYQLAADSIDEALEDSPRSPRLLTDLAGLKLMLGDENGARQDLDQAIKLADADKPLYDSNLLSELQQLNDPAWLAQARRQHARLVENRQPFISGALALRERGNDEGLDTLRQSVIPLRGEYTLDNGNRLGVTASFMTLDAGKLTASDRARFGSLAVNTTADLDSISEDESGAALQGWYQHRNWRFELATTPTDFPISNITGGIQWKQLRYNHRLALFARREALKESLLSYAGSRDPGTGITWGGVTRTGAGVEYSRNLGPADLSLRAAGWQLAGDHVTDNNETDLQTVLNWPLINSEQRSLTAGLRLNYKHFDKNLSGFTLGHGGYFSPQDYFTLTFPLEYSHQIDRFHYRFGADFGLQQFRESSTDLFPLNTGLQATINAQSSINPDVLPQTDQAQKTSGIYTFQGEFGYSLDERFVIGGWAATNNSNNFKEVRGGAFIKYRWGSTSVTQTNASNTMTTQEVW